MKKALSLVLSSIALITLVSCGTKTTSFLESSTANPDSTSGQESTPSSSEVNTSSSSSGTSQASSSSAPQSSSSSNSSSNVSSQSSQDNPSSNSSEQTSSTPVPVYYKVTFLNYNDVLLQEIQVLEGEEAVYSGATPTKPDDDVYTYTFDGWDKDLTNIASDLTTRATYKQEKQTGWGDIIWF